uniref:Uncharacterized protein n=1 Tax=Lepeophtheirus salmonis TaxID=72036 RepID=A0A0K2VA30_LEPSM
MCCEASIKMLIILLTFFYLASLYLPLKGLHPQNMDLFLQYCLL